MKEKGYWFKFRFGKQKYTVMKDTLSFGESLRGVLSAMAGFGITSTIMNIFSVYSWAFLGLIGIAFGLVIYLKSYEIVPYKSKKRKHGNHT